jgi:hypothetical protein
VVYTITPNPPSGLKLVEPAGDISSYIANGYVYAGTSTTDNVVYMKSSSYLTFTGPNGSVGAGSNVKLYEGSTQIGSCTANSQGSFSCNVTFASPGAHYITSKQIDTVGNTSVLTSPILIILNFEFFPSFIGYSDSYGAYTGYDPINYTATSYCGYDNNGDPTGGGGNWVMAGGSYYTMIFQGSGCGELYYGINSQNVFFTVNSVSYTSTQQWSESESTHDDINLDCTPPNLSVDLRYLHFFYQ